MKPNRALRSTLFTTIILILALTQIALASPALPGAVSPASKIDSALRPAFAAAQSGEKVRVIIHLRDQADLQQVQARTSSGRAAAVKRALLQKARQAQQPVVRHLAARQQQGKAEQVRSLWVINALSVAVTPEVAAELAAMPEVAAITPDEIDVIPISNPAYGEPEANLAAIGAPALWDQGYLGQGVVVATLDTGVSLNHPELAARWRGGNNSWFDPYNQHDTPADLNGHGTQTMGVIVGGDSGGPSVGVAPQARWIAVKIFNDRGAASATAIHLGFQWLLDPDGNPATADTPQVVNNSWAFGGPRCNLEFQQDLRALRTAGILPVFAAGNYGPNPNTSPSPANYPEAFAVGAIDNNGGLYARSSRGPSACGELSTIYPEIVAPGVNIYTTDRTGAYTTVTGTSLSAPHAAGVLALLLSAMPNLTADRQGTALIQSAIDLGSPGPDNLYGYGRLDAPAALQWLQSEPAEPTSTPIDTATPLPETSTPTATLPPSPTPTATDTPSPTATSTQTPTPTAAPSETPAVLPSATITTDPNIGGDTVFADSFESGGLDRWSSTSSSDHLSVDAQAALSGGLGLKTQINSTTAVYVRDNSPAAENRYRAQFYFSPNGVSIPDRMAHDLFMGLDASGRALLRIQMRAFSGSYQVRVFARAASGGMLSTAWYPLNNSAHIIEIAWNASTSNGAADGSMALMLAGATVEARTGLQLDIALLESIQLGPQALSSGISGTEYYDAFSSTRGGPVTP